MKISECDCNTVFVSERLGQGEHRSERRRGRVGKIEFDGS